MKRKIKFRAWDEQQQIMHNDFQFVKTGDEGNDWIVFTSDKQTLTTIPHPLENPFFSQQLKIMQFTGLHDKNGKEIYEGDILNQKVHKEQNNWASEMIHKPENAFPISFKNGSFVDECNRPIGEWIVNIVSHQVEFEVIGNIYENPELLEQKGDNQHDLQRRIKSDE